MQTSGEIATLPRLFAVQAEAFAPLVRAFDAGGDDAPEVPGGTTIAEGVAISRPVRGKALEKHPMWYLNLRDDPNVGVQVGAEQFNARARTATPEEKARLWPSMASIWPAYDDYQKKTSRDIPVIILERV